MSIINHLKNSDVIIIKRNTGIDIYQKIIEDPKLLGDNREVIEIDGIKALKETIVNEENNPGKVEMVWIPFNDTVYLFETDLFGEDQEECENHFNNFLKTISIRK